MLVKKLDQEKEYKKEVFFPLPPPPHGRFNTSYIDLLELKTTLNIIKYSLESILVYSIAGIAHSDMTVPEMCKGLVIPRQRIKSTILIFNSSVNSQTRCLSGGSM